jgi:hypothetical protein
MVIKAVNYSVCMSAIIAVLAGCATVGAIWQENIARNMPGTANLSASNGECISGNCEDGQGILTFPNGSKYVGEFKNGAPDGQSIFTGEDGTKYIGEFKNGRPDGQGDLIFSNGSEYIGKFKNGFPDGPGTFTDSNNGNIEKGVWRNNVWHIDE